jgi:small conductance mechanosensitive channel
VVQRPWMPTAVLDPATASWLDRLGESFQQYGERILGQLPNLLLAALALVLTVLVARSVRRGVDVALRRTSAEPHAGVVVATLAFYGVIAVGLVVALSLGGVNLGVLVGSLGLATVALGFALQDIVSNFTAGIVLLLEHPFTRGDYIAIDQAEGTVEDIQVRATRLRTPDGQLVLVPNKLLFTNVLTNASATVRRRVEVLVDIPNGQDADRAKELLLAAAARVDGVSDDPPPRLLTQDIGREGLRLRLRFWIDPGTVDLGTDDLLRVRGELLDTAGKALRDAGIDLGVPDLGE